ncbi:RING-H2 zinc finger protein RHA1A, putative [Perkinsus marinus ATCC 50983]|uniref:RING-H2 zinc finger protein RHA1A, putative n=1 Tax=Perkinsus marinus (strain ATCC 50983 / TXsc) TaxID=423536 RepID=C5L6A3_PERM5|nr:RING-H2 zinc finger protein RHA1A, putative [Perkinsus marinus ATCC 50983]EER07730.1 RING-H2 zinc finger protein RHA1A, putative [Perkinsus marinus ATCC 50983]|eukprot:XP_002775914.1 RING-H2 zinc finger protein RHA1A, putative [Perkinsus marinus ATCC 50983]
MSLLLWVPLSIVIGFLLLHALLAFWPCVRPRSSAQSDSLKHLSLNGTVQTYEVIMAAQEDVNDRARYPVQECCSICLSSYTPRSKVRKLCCGHLYHEDCVCMWLENDPYKQCPYCREGCLRNPDKERQHPIQQQSI